MAHFANRVRLAIVAGGVMLLAMSRAAAEEARPPTAVETWASYAAVGDSGHHAEVGAGVRVYPSPQLSVSPRMRYARTVGDTPDEHTDVYLETALALDLRRPANGRPPIVSPFLLVSGGAWIQRTAETDVSSGGTVYHYPEIRAARGTWSAMVGARLFLPFARGRMYVAPEVGFAPFMTPTVAAPVTFGLTLREQDDAGRTSQVRPLHGR